MDFTKEKKEYEFAEPSSKNERIRKMGLNNTVCENPTHWCRLHKCWLSKEDVEHKQCHQRPTMDLISYCECTCLVPVQSFPVYEQVYGNKQ